MVRVFVLITRLVISDFIVSNMLNPPEHHVGNKPGNGFPPTAWSEIADSDWVGQFVIVSWMGQVIELFREFSDEGQNIVVWMCLHYLAGNFIFGLICGLPVFVITGKGKKSRRYPASEWYRGTVVHNRGQIRLSNMVLVERDSWCLASMAIIRIPPQWRARSWVTWTGYAEEA